MPNDLELLLKLQVIDYDLGELERSKEYIPDMMQNLNREIKQSKERLDTEKKQLQEAQAIRKNLELEIASREAELQQAQQKMMSIKTNKEYDALVAEIDSAKEFISNKETELLETIELIETLEKQISEDESKVEEVEQNNARQLQILQEKIDSIGDKVASKENERDEVSSRIPRRTLSMYERVRRGKGGTAVVVVKKRACGACYKALTPQKVQEIKKGERIHTCENCGSLLFWDDSVSDE
jgi:hypothetical protein